MLILFAFLFWAMLSALAVIFIKGMCVDPYIPEEEQKKLEEKGNIISAIAAFIIGVVVLAMYDSCKDTIASIMIASIVVILFISGLMGNGRG